MISVVSIVESMITRLLDDFTVVLAKQRPGSSKAFVWRVGRRVTVLVGVACLSAAAAVHGVGDRPARSIVLRMSGAPAITGAPQAQGYQSAQPPESVTVIQDRAVSGSPQRERNPELAADMFVVVGVDARGEEVARVTIPDPRVIRAETPEPTGELGSHRMMRGDVEFSVLLPDEPDIVVLRIYKPRWTGDYYVLDYYAETALR